MKNELQEQLLAKALDIITAIQSGVGKVADFTLEQLPDVAQQYVAFGRAYYTVEVVLYTIIIITIVSIWLYSCHKHKWDVDVIGLGGLLSLIVGIPPIIALSEAFKPCLMAWFAPKIYLITELARLLK